ncbi:MAG: glutamate 5-kinase [Armatimonadetes bacterium]|nr:glutamate 5-kinase [Armatimonadota bacterium]NIO74878.1 glutamate 5-kinase [Armatimonadota bacterium]NIO95639.1 glutamate 5-kinase [Armatimonadota bacterium]
MSGRESLSAARRLVVKVGSNALCQSSGELDLGVLESLAGEIAGLAAEKRQSIIVTSGAVKIGLCRLGQKKGKDLATRQAAAAVGQSELLSAYQRAFGAFDRPVAQILLTQAELSDFRRYLRLSNVLNSLIARHGAIPILNENDPVSAAGVEIGENDRLAALVASKIDADLLVLLSDVEGFCTGNPARIGEVSLIPEVEKITPEMEALAEQADDRGGSGGMKAKLEAASIATRAGVAVAIASSRAPRVLSRLLAGEQVGTFFSPARAKLQARKRWIGFARRPKGKLVVDEGAARAMLEQGSSLLPVGVANVEGEFAPGDTVSVVDFSGKEIARGLANYNADEVRLIRRCKTREIRAKLGRHDYDEVIHRDNLVVL